MRTCFALGLLFLAMALMLSACVSRPIVRADLWQAERIPPAFCIAQPEIAEFGIYRVIGEDEEEFISYCHPAIEKYLSLHQDEADRLLREATKPR